MSDMDQALNHQLLPKLGTPRLELRPFQADDCQPLERLLQDSQIHLNTNLNLASDSNLEEWINSLTSVWQQGRGVAFAISLPPPNPIANPFDPQGHAGGSGHVDQGQRILVGGIGLELDPSNHCGELGFWIGREYRRNGFATEAAAAVMKYGFEGLGLNKITASHLETNPVSGKILREMGMEIEGVLRKQVRRSGSFYDLICYGVLAKDFRYRSASSS